jgi:Protein of unknown function (DUF1168)
LVCACAVVKPESVVNPYGSTAGAHSGEFHVYRKTRNAEMQRMAAFHAADAERAKDLEFHSKLQRDAEILERKTNKKRNKRQKSKESKVRRKNLAHAGIDVSATATTNTSERHQQDDRDADKDEDDEDEFPMIPLPAPAAALPLAPNGDTAGDESSTTSKAAAEGDAAAAATATSSAVEFANDGSFLEMAQKKLATGITTEPTTTKTLEGK